MLQCSLLPQTCKSRAIVHMCRCRCGDEVVSLGQDPMQSNLELVVAELVPSFEGNQYYWKNCVSKSE